MSRATMLPAMSGLCFVIVVCLMFATYNVNGATECMGRDYYTCVFESTTPGEMQFKLVDLTVAGGWMKSKEWSLIRGTYYHPFFTITKEIVKLEFPDWNMAGSIFFRKNEKGEPEADRFESTREYRQKYMLPEYSWYIKPDDKDVEKVLVKQNEDLNQQEIEVDRKIIELKDTVVKVTPKHKKVIDEIKVLVDNGKLLDEDLRKRTEEELRLKEKLDEIGKEKKEIDIEYEMGCNVTVDLVKSKDSRIKMREDEIERLKENRKLNEETKKREGETKEDERRERLKRQKQEMEKRTEQRKQEKRERERKRKVKRRKKPTSVVEAKGPNVFQRWLARILRMEFGRSTLFYIQYHSMVDKQLERKSGVVYRIHEWIANLIRRIVGLDQVGLDDYILPYSIKLKSSN